MNFKEGEVKEKMEDARLPNEEIEDVKENRVLEGNEELLNLKKNIICNKNEDLAIIFARSFHLIFLH